MELSTGTRLGTKGQILDRNPPKPLGPPSKESTVQCDEFTQHHPRRRETTGWPFALALLSALGRTDVNVMHTAFHLKIEIL